MPRLRRKERADYAPDHIPEEEEVTPSLTETSEPSEYSDSDIAPGEEELLGDSEQQANLYVSRSTYDRPVIEKPPEPVPEHPIQEHKHLVLDDLVDDGGQVLGAEMADIYQSRSTYVLEPTPPKEPHPTRHRRRTIDDISPDDTGLVDESYKTIYESESTYEVGEIGSVVLESAEKLIAKAKKTATETSIVLHSRPTYEIDDLEGAVVGEELGEIYESKSTYEVEKTVDATGLYLTGLALSGGVSFVRGAASTVNPFAWAEGLHDLTYLSRSPYTQKQLAEHIAEDPLRFVVDLGFSMAGGYYAGKLIYGGLARKWQEGKLAQFYDEFPEEAFYAEDGIPDPRIPHPTDVERMAIKSSEQVRIVDDLGEGFLDAHQITVGKIKPDTLKTLDLRMGKAALSNWEDFAKGYYRTGHDLIPGLVPQGLGRIETVYKFGLEYGQTHLPGLTGLPPYFEAALESSSLSGYLSGVGGATGLLTGITPDIDDPLGIEKVDTIQEVIPTIDDTGLYELPKIIEMVDETFIQEPKLVDPITILKPIHDPKQDPLIEPGYEPYPPEELPKIIDRLDEDVIPILIPPDFIQKQEPVQDPIINQIPILKLPTYTEKPPRKPPILRYNPPKREKRRIKHGGAPPLGYEMREYKLPRLGGSKSKGGKLPSLDIPPTKIKKSRRKLPKL